MADDWVGPLKLTPELLTFADAYYTAVGRDRSFTKAAIKAGKPNKTAYQFGHLWSTYSVVKKYWEDAMMLDRVSLAAGRSHVLGSLEEIACDDTLEPDYRIQSADVYMRHVTADSPKNSAPTDAVPDDESTMNTLAQISHSISRLVDSYDADCVNTDCKKEVE